MKRSIGSALFLSGSLWMLTGFLATAALYVALVLLPVSIRPTSTWVQEIYLSKAAAMEAASNRVVLVGGSSVHFGMNARVMAFVTGRPTINFGTHAGLGLDYILYRARRQVGSGDIVVLAPEYELFGPPSDQGMASYVRSFDLAYVMGLPLRKKIGVATSISLRELILTYLPFDIPPTYDSRLVTKEGDENGNVLQRRSVSRWTYASSDRGPAPFLGGVSSDAARKIASFVDECRKRGARVVATWPAIVDVPSHRGVAARAVQERIAELYGRIGVLMFGQPQDALIPPEELFDTHYHPLDSWAAKRSVRLGYELKELLGAGSGTATN